ncbi:replication protein A 32 kDa subunit B-like isoform X1 [Cucumis melo]|uniref:Replication protein A 32 kDa subunit B-like isoform X1 n=1 Tax=Cucumis melo TaxID=3656 RepID=A0A9I9DF17_CUCME|nr:replication protein A 32 kDa subunit B-like isoform X1 [Cucumis melo]XP_050936917.1 replication protein A 32 kDa subunit B-like isoform X1 [Cucumis melo]XP_050936918.1 replication protein A 32 kDa subunit B-like isoform X1 [Cucumis melo]
MYASQFDGNAAFSGGGFMPSQTTQAPDHSFSPAKNRDVQALLPLTVKQINDAFLSSDDKSNFVIDGVDVNNVKLVGMVRNRAGRITDVTFALDDGTGRIDCSKWVNEAADSNEVEGILDGMYVRVHGHLKSFQGKRTLNVFSISACSLQLMCMISIPLRRWDFDMKYLAYRPVTDYNEITNHFIESIYVHFYNTRLRKQQSSSMTTQPQMTNLSNTPVKGYQAPIANQYTGQAGGDSWKSLEQMVLDFLQLPSCDSERGAHRDVIAQQLKVPLEKLIPAMKNLEEEGLIYSTTDDYHFKSTANG